MFKLKYDKQTIPLTAVPATTLDDLMFEIRDLTGVFPSRQQISYGYPLKQLPTDEVSRQLSLAQLGFERRELFTVTQRSAGPPQTMTQMKSGLSEAFKHEIDGDNSCLFNAVAYLCTGNSNRASELRRHIIQEIRTRPEIYTEVTLGQTPNDYCRWISDPEHWGGYIEMEIMSRLYSVEICVLHIEKANMVPVNACHSKKRIFVLYDNTHYDSIVFRGFGVTEQRIVDCDDDTAMGLAMQLVQVVHASGEYRNQNVTMFRCDDCGKVVQGKKGANDHGIATGHVNFSAAKM
jgi:ubiquitin thioesterase OTU1